MTTTAVPWPSTVQSHYEPEPGLADQVASLLWLERGVVIAIVGREGGRTSGFLADLTHTISQRATVLRIRTPLQPTELFHALAGQLGVATEGLDPVQIAARVGERLNEAASLKRYVLVCEGAQHYPAPMLEALRQLSNHPLNIVLCGTRRLTRRLGAPSLSALKQRINYQLDVEGAGFARYARPLAIGFVLAALAYAALIWWTPHEPPADEVVHPITTRGTPPARASTPVPTGSDDTALQLTLERSLTHAPPAE